MPDALAYLWEWFIELSAARGASMSGLAAITYRDVEAWSRLTGRVLDQLELSAIMHLDVAFRHPGEADDDG